MSEVHNLLDDMGLTCEEIINGDNCGSAKFNLLKSGKIECVSCGHKSLTKAWLGMENMPEKFKAPMVSLMTMTKDDWPACLITLTGLGFEMCRQNGMDLEGFLTDIANHELLEE